MKRLGEKRTSRSLSWQRLLGALAAVYIGVASGAWFLADRLIFIPHPAGYVDSSIILKVPTADGGRLSAQYVPNPQAAYTILYSHGNAEDLSNIQWELGNLHELGFAVFAYDYRGYGTSNGGPPSVPKACRDAEAAYDYLTRELRTPPEKIIIYGRSVGAGMAVHLATRRSAAGLVLESPFVSAFRVITHYALFPFDKLANLRNIHKVGCPVLVMHGTLDRVIPFWHGQTVYAAAATPKSCLWVEGAGHNDLAEIAGARYATALQTFAAGLKAP